MICGPEFGLANARNVALIFCALYGGKVTGRDFQHHLRSYMDDLGFKSFKADPDVQFMLSKQANEDKYYQYVLLYVYDCLVISDRANSLL